MNDTKVTTMNYDDEKARFATSVELACCNALKISYGRQDSRSTKNQLFK